MNNLDKQYQQLLKSITEYGVQKNDRTGTGTKSIFGYTIRHNMSEGFPLLTSKKMAWKTMVTELLWFLRGDTNIKYLVDNDCHIWDGDAYKNYATKTSMDVDGQYSKEEFINRIKNDDKFAKKWGGLGPIYGEQWRNWKQYKWDKVDMDTRIEYVDQISRVISHLRTEPDSRRMMVNAWNVAELNQMVLPPCHYGFQVYTRELDGEERWDLLKKEVGEEKFKTMVDDIVPFGGGLSEELQSYNIPKRAISLMWNQRSVDTFLGLPFNIASYGLLLVLLGKVVNMVPETLIGNLGDAHLYNDHLEQAQEQIGRTSFDLPSVELNFDFTFRDKYLVAWDKVKLDDIVLKNYISHPSIKAPLSN